MKRLLKSGASMGYMSSEVYIYLHVIKINHRLKG